MIAASPPPLDRPAIEDALRQAYRDVDGGLSLGDEVRRFLGDLLVRAFRLAFGSDGTVGVLVAVVALALLALVVWWAVRLLGLVGGGALADPRSGAAPRPVDWARVAEQARERGDLETAVRARWQHLLAVLDARGLVHDAPSLTAAEAATAVATASPPLAPAVSRAATAVERVVFLDEPATVDHDGVVRDAADQARSR